SGATRGYTTCAIITASAPASMPAANGTRSSPWITSSGRSSIAWSKWVSSRTEPWPGEMLERGPHAGLVQPFDVGAREFGDHLGPLVEGAVSDGQVAAPQVHHRGEAQVDAGRQDFAGHQPGMFARAFDCRARVLVVEPPEPFKGGQRAVPLAETLDAAALLVHAYQLGPRRGLADRRGQLGHLRARG